VPTGHRYRSRPCLVSRNISFKNFSFWCAKGFYEAIAKFLSAAMAKCVSGSCTKTVLPLFNAMQSTNKSMDHSDKQNRRVPSNHLFKSSNTLKGNLYIHQDEKLLQVSYNYIKKQIASNTLISHALFDGAFAILSRNAFIS
jgi:hypothetical protein